LANGKPKKTVTVREPKPKGERKKPQYKDTTVLSRRQGTLLSEYERIEARVKVVREELTELAQRRDKVADELRSIATSLSSKLEGVLGVESPPAPETSES